jgi:transposase
MVKKKMNEFQLIHLQGKLSFPPSYYGYDKGFWTGKLVSDLIYKTFKIEYSTRRVNELLNEIDYSYKRPRMKSILSDKKEQ